MLIHRLCLAILMKWRRKRYTVYLIGGALLSLFPSPNAPPVVKRLEKAGTNVPDLPKKEKSEEKYRLLGAIQQSHDLGAGAVRLGAELAVSGTAGDAVLICPSDSLGIVGICRHIAETATTHCGRTGSAIEEGNGLAAGHSPARGEGLRVGSAGDAILNGPQDCAVVIVRAADVLEGIRRGIGRGTTGSTPLS